MNDLSSSTCPVRAEQLAELTDMPFFFCNTSTVNSSCMFPMMSTDLAPPLSSRVLCVCRIWLLHIKKFCESWSATPNVQHSPSQYCMLPYGKCRTHAYTYISRSTRFRTKSTVCALAPSSDLLQAINIGMRRLRTAGCASISSNCLQIHQIPMEFTKWSCRQEEV